MADLKAGEAFTAGCMIVTPLGVAATGLAPTATLFKLSDDSTTNPAVAEVSGGVYDCTFTPDAAGGWILKFAVAGNYYIYGAVQLFKVGGGNVADVETAVDAILLDVTAINGDAMRGTDGAALVASGWDAGLATILDNFTAARIGYLDELDFDLDARFTAIEGGGFAAETLVAIYNLLDAILDLTETGGTLAATGGEDTIYLANAPAGVWEPRHVLIDLTNMAGVDDVTIRIYYRIKNGENLILQYEESYLGDQSVDLWEQQLAPNRYGVQVTLEQTAGVNRNYDWEVLYNG